MESIYLVPTRGRPANALRLARAWKETGTSTDTRLTFILDDDDPELQGYHDVFTQADQDDLPFGFTVGPRRRLGGTLNYFGPRAAEHYDAVGFMGDDHLPRTQGWDQMVTAAVAGSPGAVVYGNDLLQGRNLPTAVLLDARLVAAMDFMVPPGLVHLYMDNFWKDLGTATGNLIYLPHVVIEHVHPVAGKAAWDARYEEVNAGEVYAGDEARYAQFKSGREWTAAMDRVLKELAK